MDKASDISSFTEDNRGEKRDGISYCQLRATEISIKLCFIEGSDVSCGSVTC